MARPRAPAWLLLTLATLFWGGNFVLGRAMRGHAPPIALSFWRWAVALLLLLPFTWRGLWAQRRALGAGWLAVVVLGILGVGNFNTLLYVGLRDTTATNAVLLNAACPALIVAIASLGGHGRPTRARVLGIALSLAGVAVILTQGRPASLRDFRLNPGDAWVLGAVLSWALYTVLLARRPAGIDPLVLLTAFMAAGLAWIAPFYAWEISKGAVLRLDAPTLGAVAYVAVFPSILAYAFWNAGVASLGPSRAGAYGNLMPAFGTVLAVALIGESFHAFHAVGIGLILAGVWMAGR
jgi:drug/metabolite transporter (DMT)-like permease